MRFAIRNLVPDYLIFTQQALYASRHPDVFSAYFETGGPGS